MQERKNVPAVGPCVDRRVFEATLDVYNDKNIQALICMCCARICLQTAGPRSSIEYKKGIWFLKLPAGPLQVRWSEKQIRECITYKRKDTKENN